MSEAGPSSDGTETANAADAADALDAPDAADGADAADAADFEVPPRELLALCLGDARFGLWVDEVLEIVRTPPISRLPLPHPELVGVTSVRGEVIPVLDLGRRLLGTPARRPGRLVLVRHQETEAIVALLVDAVDTLVNVRSGDIREAPSAAEAALPPELVMGVVADEDRIVMILHLGRAAAPPESDPNEE